MSGLKFLISLTFLSINCAYFLLLHPPAGRGGPVTEDTYASLHWDVHLSVTLMGVGSGVAFSEPLAPTAASTSHFRDATHGHDVDLTDEDASGGVTSLTLPPLSLSPASKEIAAQVEALGFSPMEAHNAVSRCSSVEAAVDWILANPGLFLMLPLSVSSPAVIPSEFRVQI